MSRTGKTACGSYDNTAAFSAAGGQGGQASASIVVTGCSAHGV